MYPPIDLFYHAIIIGEPWLTSPSQLSVFLAALDMVRLDPQAASVRAERLTPLDDRIYRAARHGGRFPHFSEWVLVDGLILPFGECCLHSSLGQD